jgi:hypothetical protein
LWLLLNPKGFEVFRLHFPFEGFGLIGNTHSRPCGAFASTAQSVDPMASDGMVKSISCMLDPKRQRMKMNCETGQSNGVIRHQLRGIFRQAAPTKFRNGRGIATETDWLAAVLQPSPQGPNGNYGFICSCKMAQSKRGDGGSNMNCHFLNLSLILKTFNIIQFTPQVPIRRFEIFDRVLFLLNTPEVTKNGGWVGYRPETIKCLTLKN